MTWQSKTTDELIQDVTSLLAWMPHRQCNQSLTMGIFRQIPTHDGWQHDAGRMTMRHVMERAQHIAGHEQQRSVVHQQQGEERQRLRLRLRLCLRLLLIGLL